MTNLRRIPTGISFMIGNNNIKKKPNDMLYGYLQLISTYCNDTSTRFIYKVSYRHIDVERYFGYSSDNKAIFPRKNVERAFKQLIDIGYIEATKIIGLKGNIVPIYKLIEVKEEFQLITLNSLETILSKHEPNLLKLYCYFKSNYYKNKQFTFTYKQIITECFGLKSSKNKKTLDNLKKLLSILKDLDYIKYVEFSILNKQGKPTPYKKILYVK